MKSGLCGQIRWVTSGSSTMKKFKAENFQIHESLELDLAPFTVIVGPSGSGKSAVIRALKVLFYNVPAGGFVRRGAKKLTISLEDGENVIHYDRSPSVQYTLNGETFNAIGRNALPNIEAIGYSSIEIDKKRYYPQIASQFDTPFLISFSDAEVSKLLSELSQAGRIKVAKQSINKSQFAISDKLKIRFEDREALQLKIQALDPVLNKKARFDEILASYKALQQEKSVLDKVKGLTELIRGYKSQVLNVPKTPENPDSYIKVYNLLYNKKYDIPEISKLSAALDKLVQIHTVRANLAKIGPEKGVQKKITPEKIGAEIDLVLQDFSILKELSGLNIRLYGKDIQDVTELQTELSSLDEQLKELTCETCGQFLNQESTHKLHG